MSNFQGENSFPNSWYLEGEAGGERRLGFSVLLSRTHTATFIFWHLGLQPAEDRLADGDRGSVQKPGNLAGSS